MPPHPTGFGRVVAWFETEAPRFRKAFVWAGAVATNAIALNVLHGTALHYTSFFVTVVGLIGGTLIQNAPETPDA